LECYRQGLPIAQIAKQVHLARATVSKYLAAESLEDTLPAISIPWDGQTLGSLHSLVSRKRCEEGCQNAKPLYREIHVQGFSGNPRTVLRWLQAQGLFPRRSELRQALDNWDHPVEKEPQSNSASEEVQPAPVPASQELLGTVELTEPLASARQLSYLFVKDPSRLQAKDQQVLAFLKQDKEIELAYRMTQQFIHLLKSRQGDTAMAWINICSSCGIAELEAFALGLQKEFPAFQAACSLPYSNGMTEGFVNKLKHIKGSMYGRGSFELLRKRVLQPAA
jgi:transposase